MDPKECHKLRADAFELLNKAQHCNTDADCRQSDWPGCAKPLSIDTFDKIKPMKEKFQKGKCEEQKDDVPRAARGLLQAGALRSPGEGHAGGRRQHADGPDIVK